MVSKLNQRRTRRLKADVAWWMAEAHDWKEIALEHAVEIDRLRKLVIRVPMPVMVPKEIIRDINVQAAFVRGIERYGDAMLELAGKERADDGY